MNRQLLLALVALLVQAGVLGTTWQRAYYPTDPAPDSEWKKIYLALQPVDPRSLFQGNYVQLRYEIHSVTRSKVAATDADIQYGRSVYATLEQHGEVWSVSKVTLEPPKTGELFITGRTRYAGNSGSLDIIYGIEQFYAPKEAAEKLESRTRRSWNGPSAKMVALVVVNAHGRAGLVDIVPAS